MARTDAKTIGCLLAERRVEDVSSRLIELIRQISYDRLVDFREVSALSPKLYPACIRRKIFQLIVRLFKETTIEVERRTIVSVANYWSLYTKALRLVHHSSSKLRGIVDARTVIEEIEMFYKNTTDTLPGENGDSYWGISPELFSEGASRLFYWVIKTGKSDAWKLVQGAGNRINRKLIRKAISDFCLFHSIDELEVGVLQLGFEIFRVNGSEFHVNRREAIFGKPIFIGFTLQTMYSAHVFSKSIEENGKLRFVDLLNEYYETHARSIFSVSKDWPKRIIGSFDEASLVALFKMFWEGDECFSDEILNWSENGKSVVADYQDVLSLRVSGTLTHFEALKINRILLFFAYLRTRELRRRFDKQRTEVYYNSLTLFFRHEVIRNLMKESGIPEEKIDSYFALVSWKTSYPASPANIHYRPLIDAGKGMYLLPNVYLNTNLFRNLLGVSKARPNSDGKDDPMGKILEAALKNVKIPCIRRLKHKKGDIDLAFAIGGTLFLVELKSSLHPSNLFEMRTTFDYLKKATEQLGAAESEVKTNVALRKRLEKDLGFNVEQKVQKIFVFSHRFFNGENFKGIKIRSLWEFENVIAGGELAFGRADNPQTLRFSEKFENGNERVLDYLSDQFSIFEAINVAATDATYAKNTRYFKLFIPWWEFDMELFISKMCAVSAAAK